MNDVERWILLDGAEPEPLRELFAAPVELPPLGREGEEDVVRAVLARIDGSAMASVRAPVAGGAGQGGGREDRSGDAVRIWMAEDAASVVERRGGTVAEVDGEPPADLPSAPVTVGVAGTAGCHHAEGAPSIERPSIERPPALGELVGVVPSVQPEAPARSRPSAAVAGTAELPSGVLRRRDLPFKRPEEIPAAQRSKRTLQSPVVREGVGETFPVGSDAIHKAIAMLPFAGEALGQGVVPLPALSLEQYASFCVEVALWPDHLLWIRRRYHVANEAAHVALDEHWEQGHAASSEARGAFERACALYREYLWGRSR